jgi:hypothetical protein
MKAKTLFCVGSVCISIAAIVATAAFSMLHQDSPDSPIGVNGVLCEGSMAAEYLGEAFERGVNLGMPALGLDAYAIHQGRRKTRPWAIPACTIVRDYRVTLTIGAILPGMRTIITVMHAQEGVTPETRYLVVLNKSEMNTLTREFGDKSLQASTQP